jgi:hypothetical protein
VCEVLRCGSPARAYGRYEREVWVHCWCRWTGAWEGLSGVEVCLCTCAANCEKQGEVYASVQVWVRACEGVREERGVKQSSAYSDSHEGQNCTTRALVTCL